MSPCHLWLSAASQVELPDTQALPHLQGEESGVRDTSWHKRRESPLYRERIWAIPGFATDTKTERRAPPPESSMGPQASLMVCCPLQERPQTCWRCQATLTFKANFCYQFPGPPISGKPAPSKGAPGLSCCLLRFQCQLSSCPQG